jgi:hypothetical protein
MDILCLPPPHGWRPGISEDDERLMAAIAAAWRELASLSGPAIPRRSRSSHAPSFKGRPDILYVRVMELTGRDPYARDWSIGDGVGVDGEANKAARETVIGLNKTTQKLYEAFLREARNIKPVPVDFDEDQPDDPTLLIFDDFETLKVLDQINAAGGNISRFRAAVDRPTIHLGLPGPNGEPASPAVEPLLRRAGSEQIHAASTRVYDEAEREMAPSTSPPSSEPPITTDQQATPGNVVKRLAEWIFAHRSLLHHHDKLLAAALKDVDLPKSIGTFLKAEFRAAYQLVYETQRYRSPVTGWPLREPFKSREKEAKHKE